MFDLSIPNFYNPLFHREGIISIEDCDFYKKIHCFKVSVWGSEIKHGWTHDCSAPWREETPQ